MSKHTNMKKHTNNVGEVLMKSGAGRSSRGPRFDREWMEIIGLLPEERRGVMEDAIRAYQADGTEPVGLDGAEMMAFLLIKKIVDRRKRMRDARLRRKQCAAGSNTVALAENMPSGGELAESKVVKAPAEEKPTNEVADGGNVLAARKPNRSCAAEPESGATRRRRIEKALRMRRLKAQARGKCVRS